VCSSDLLENYLNDHMQQYPTRHPFLALIESASRCELHQGFPYRAVVTIQCALPIRE
jgi:hypothetical protein